MVRAFCDECDALVPVGDDGRDRFGHAVTAADGPEPGSTGPAEEPEPWVFSVDPAADQPPAAPPHETDRPVAAQRPARTGPVEEPPAWTAPVSASHDEGDHPLEVDDHDAPDRRYELDDDTFDAASLEAAVAELGFSLETADEGVAERDVARPSDDRWAAQEAGIEDRAAAETTVPPDEDETDRWRLDLDEFGLDLGAASDPDVGGTVTAPEQQAGEEPESAQAAWDVRGGHQPATDQPTGDQAEWDRPAEQQPAWDQPADQQAAWDRPAEQQAAWDQPADQQAAWDRPAEQQAAWDQPAGDQPAGDQPAWDQPAGEEPTWDQAGEDQPAADQPAGDQRAWDQPGDHEWDQPAWDQPAGGTAAAADPHQSEPAGPSAEQGDDRRRPPLDLDRFVARPSGARRGRFRRR